MATAEIVVSKSKQSSTGYESRTRTAYELLPMDPHNAFYGEYRQRYQYEQRRTVVTTTSVTVSEARGFTAPGAPVSAAHPDLDGGGTTVDVVYQRSSEAGIYTRITTVTEVRKRYGGWVFYGRLDPEEETRI